VIDSSPRIRLLDSHTINQIAAGEVVERPAAALKELIENALDAGARKIEIDLVESGKTLIRVSDDGCGMSREEAELAIQRHATSKIGSVEDLTRVGTLGFRGEALPSIASVSHFTLSTAREDGLRTVIRVDGSEIRPPEGAAGPKGTEIVVEDLFFNTPARLKFLKSETTELANCTDFVERYAIAYPHVSFAVTHNGQPVLRTTGNGDRLEAIAEAWSRDIARGLVEVDANVSGFRLRGFVSPPHLNRHSRRFQFLYVNGRPIKSQKVQMAVDLTYRELNPERRQPIYALMLDVDPTTIDVNVTPTKQDVRFQNDDRLFGVIKHAITGALMSHGMMSSAEGLIAANEALRSAGSQPILVDYRVEAGMIDPAAEPTLIEAPLPASGIVVPPPTGGDESYPYKKLLEGLRVIGQARNTFIIAETKRGLVIIDQHVTHERILFEYLCGSRGHTAIEKQPLLVPQTLHLDRRSAVLLRERLDEIVQVGFEIEPFGGESYVVRAVPAAIKGKDPLKVLRDMVDEMVEATVTRRLPPTREQIWITSACKMAVKAGDPLSLAEMEKLVVDLAGTENPYYCPHGRPITVTIDGDDLSRAFHRK